MAPTAAANEASSVPANCPEPKSHSRARWRRWALAAVVILIGLSVAGLSRIRQQNAITYETVLVERGSIQARVTATGNLTRWSMCS